MKKSLPIFVFIFLTVIFSNLARSMAAEPLVDTGWLAANKDKPGVVLLDIRGQWEYRNAHIPGSVYTEYGGRKGWRAMKNGVMGMLPDTPYMEKLIGGLGIGNNDHVVIIPGGYSAAEMGIAARIYWTFKVLGHDEVSILDGGITAWAGRKLPLVRGEGSPPKAKTFKARFNKDVLATAADVKKAIKDGGATLIDSRPSDQFRGINKSGAVKRAGTLPGAKNVPGVWMTRDNGGDFRTKEDIRKLYGLAGAPTKGPLINFCNTGHWASLGWFVSSEILGDKKAKMYDGSLAEWSQDKSNPIYREVTVD
jgi:thiosulfate/3-mercaptopyruvate sulfurtransferase